MEVDQNSHVINLVQNRPVLYTKCNDFRARNHQWKEIADILKVDASWIKSRWHILRERFLAEYSGEIKGKRSNFKYFNEMSFLVDHINIEAFDMHTKSEEFEHPEFVITQKNLDETSDDDSANMFVELEVDNNSNKDIQSFDLSAEVSDDAVEETVCIPSGESSGRKPLPSEVNCKQNAQSKVETFHIIEENESNNSRVFLKSDTRNRDKSAEEFKSISEESRKSDVAVAEEKLPKEVSNKLSEQTELNQSKSLKPETLRCEDTIFGELVVATLRQMQVEKKNAVKREIMNILFT